MPNSEFKIRTGSSGTGEATQMVGPLLKSTKVVVGLTTRRCRRRFVWYQAIYVSGR